MTFRFFPHRTITQRPLFRRSTPRRAASMLLAGLIFAAGPIAAQDEDAGGQEPQLVEAVANDSRIETVVGMINSQIDGKVAIYGRAAGQRVTVLADSVPLEEALASIANPLNLVWWQDEDGNYGIADRQYYEQNVLSRKVIQKVFRPNNIKASELDRAIKGLLTPNLGSSVADDRTNKLIVNDLPQALERIERFIREIDVQLIVRVFYIRHADVEDIASKIENYKSDPGTIEVDTKTHQIIVTDLLSNIKKMELLIDILDVGPEIIIYDVNNVGIEGEDLEDLQNIIDSIRTEELLFEVNEKQGVFILEDVPEVHERVEQILAEFDKPVRQVLLQGEILSTTFQRTLDAGVRNFAIAQDFRQLEEGDISSSIIPSNFDNLGNRFPNLGYENGLFSGRWLGTRAAIELEAAYNDSRTRVLLQPRLLVRNQETSQIFVGSDVPFLTTFRDTDSNGDGFTTTTQSTVQDGLDFQATPSISNSLLIELELQIDNDNAFRVEGSNELVGKDRQNIETTLQIPSGRTRMIGGLIEHNDSRASQGIPFLSSIPILGALLGFQQTGEDTRNLVIFITPSVVEEDEVRENEGGRRGRRISSLEERIGQYDLNLEEQASDSSEIEDFLQDLNPDELLSGEAEEEEQMLRRIREREAQRRAEIDAENTSNYVPSQGIGSTTLNTAAPQEGAPNAGNQRPQERREPERPPEPPRPETRY